MLSIQLKVEGVIHQRHINFIQSVIKVQFNQPYSIYSLGKNVGMSIILNDHDQ